MMLIFLSLSIVWLTIIENESEGYEQLLTCKRDWAHCWLSIMSIPITLDFLSLHDFTNRLPILRFIIVCIGLEKVLCNNLPNSSQPTHLTFLHNVRSTIPIIQGSVRLTIIPCYLPPFLPSSLPPFLPLFELIFREAIGSIRSFPIRLGVYDPPCSQRSPKHHPPWPRRIGFGLE